MKIIPGAAVQSRNLYRYIHTGGIWNIKTAGNSGIVLEKKEANVLLLSQIMELTVMTSQKTARGRKRDLRIAGNVPGIKESPLNLLTKRMKSEVKFA